MEREAPERIAVPSGSHLALAYEAGARLANMEFVQFSLYPVGPAGKHLSHERRQELEKAKHILQERLHKQKARGKGA